MRIEKAKEGRTQPPIHPKPARWAEVLGFEPQTSRGSSPSPNLHPKRAAENPCPASSPKLTVNSQFVLLQNGHNYPSLPGRGRKASGM